jgi:hypothetical protein
MIRFILCFRFDEIQKLCGHFFLTHFRRCSRFDEIHALCEPFQLIHDVFLP